MGDGFAPEDEWRPPQSPHLPPPASRTWRHPSELGSPAPLPHPSQIRATPLQPSPSIGAPTRSTLEVEVAEPSSGRRFSGGSLLVASAVGAIAMFGVLSLIGVVTSSGVGPNGARSDDAAAPPVALAPENGIVTLRLDGPSGSDLGVGLVVDRLGDIVTTADFGRVGDATPTLGADGTLDSNVTVSVRTAAGGWTELDYVGADHTTGLSVLRIAGAVDTAPADVALAALGDTVRLARVGSSSTPRLVSRDATQRVVSASTNLRRGERQHLGLLTITAPSLIDADDAPDVVIEGAGARVVALVSPLDDNTDDELTYAIPAELAVRVARQIVLDGRASHGTIDAALTEDGGDVVVAMVVPGSHAAAAGLEVGDVITAAEGKVVHSSLDLIAALLGIGPGHPIDLRLDRNGKVVSTTVTSGNLVEQTLALTAAAPE